MELKFYTIDTEYVDYLRDACGIQNVLDNKETSRFKRPYIGIVLQVDDYKYYVPFIPLKIMTIFT